MTKAELFAGTTGIIGLVADAMTIYDRFSKNPHSSPGLQAASWATAFVFSAVYGWFILSWLLVRWNYCRRTEGGARLKGTLYSLASRSIFVLGAVLFPFVALFGYSAVNSPDFSDKIFTIILSASAMFAVGLIMSLALSVGMPLVYQDMKSAKLGGLFD